MSDLVTFGEVLAEFMALETNQSLGEAGRFAGPFPGGAPAIFIDQAAKLSRSAAMVSCVGDDAFGRMLVGRLAADGVDVSAIATRADMTTASAFVTYYDDGTRDFIFNIANSACAAIQPHQFDDVLDDCRLLHIAGTALFSETMIDLARRAVARMREIGGRVSFDPNVRKETLARPGVREAMADLVSYTDILLPSDTELNVLLGCDDHDTAVARAFELGVGEIVWKNGAEGCRYHDGKTVIEQPGFPVESVDPTGAGDCFGAAFCSLRVEGMPAEQALVYACAAGASAVSRHGAMEGTSTRDQLDAFIADWRGV